MADSIAVTKDARKYKTIITEIGEEKIAKATLEGKKVDIITAVVTDGGGQYFVPTVDMTKLENEVWRGRIANKEINEASPNMIDVKIFLDGTVGGFTVRGIGLLDSEGDLIAVCNTPDIGKAVILDGIAATLTLIMHIVVTNTDVLEFKVDPTVDAISSAELEKALRRHNEDPLSHVDIWESIVKVLDVTIPVSGWQEDGEGGRAHPLSCLISIENITGQMVPMLNIWPEYSDTAGACGLSSTSKTIQGGLKVYAKTIPSEPFQGSLTLFRAFYLSEHASEGGGAYVLPIATSTRLGVVRIKEGSGLTVDESGNLAIDVATDQEVADVFSKSAAETGEE